MTSAPTIVDETIANNGSANGILSLLIKEVDMSANGYIAIVTSVVVILLLSHFSTPSMNALEPPLIKPSFPFIGHIIGLIWHQAKYHIILRRKTLQPIATLPMLTGKMYAVWDPALIAAGLRNKNLSTTPHTIAFAKALSQLRDETDAIIRGPENDAPVVEHMMRYVIPPALAGAGLQRMNEVALAQLAIDFDSIGSESIPNVWLWLRHLMTLPTTKALYGDEDPFAKDPSLEDVLWTFEANLPKLVTNFLPSVISPAGHHARATLSHALSQYYCVRHDVGPSVSEFVRARAETLRANGIADDEIARIEIMLPFAAMVNTVPSLFWFFSFIFSKPTLVGQLREELKELATQDGDEVTIALGALEDRAPLLTSCYREMLRVTNHQVSTRTVVQDTILSNGKGNSYLLRKDNVVQMSIGTSHSIEEFWGPDVEDFNPERFLSHANGKGDSRSDGPGSQKLIKAAFQPFGGGLHLCPGRHFAYAEMMAVISTILLGFEVEPLGGGEWKLPGWATWSLIDAVTKPKGQGKGSGAQIKRREGWEGVRWKYEL
ncbi:cytochrome P450 [Ilyonectria sp. MPI-CAGE-AT-0026]|nr:cytochrome P450 [Ilyonectria sp. MPI-CAGE-AT-0026]